MASHTSSRSTRAAPRCSPRCTSSAPAPAELTYEAGRPNYYNLVLYAAASVAGNLAQFLTAWGLPPDTQRWRYRPLHTRHLFTRWATPCPNAEALAARTLQLPVHPGLSQGQVAYVARCLRAGLDRVREDL